MCFFIYCCCCYLDSYYNQIYAIAGYGNLDDWNLVALADSDEEARNNRLSIIQLTVRLGHKSRNILAFIKTFSNFLYKMLFRVCLYLSYLLYLFFFRSVKVRMPHRPPYLFGKLLLNDLVIPKKHVHRPSKSSTSSRNKFLSDF